MHPKIPSLKQEIDIWCEETVLAKLLLSDSACRLNVIRESILALNEMRLQNLPSSSTLPFYLFITAYQT